MKHWNISKQDNERDVSLGAGPRRLLKQPHRRAMPLLARAMLVVSVALMLTVLVAASGSHRSPLCSAGGSTPCAPIVKP